MFTSQGRTKDVALRSAVRYGVAAVACAVFSAIYEMFSHDVYSVWMVGLAAAPLLMGCVPALAVARADIQVGRLRRQLWACVVLTLTLGCCFAGVMEIYGAPSPWLPLYFVLAGVLGIASCLVRE